MSSRVIWIVSSDEGLRMVLEPHLRASDVEVRTADPTSFLTSLAEGETADVAVVEDPPRGLSRVSFEERLHELSPSTRRIFIAAASGEASDDPLGTALATDDVGLNVPEVVDLVSRLMGELDGGRFEEQTAEPSGAQLKECLVRCIESFAGLIERYEFVNGGNGPKVRRYAMEVARELGLEPRQVEALGVAALLYDIGMLRIRPEVKLKPSSLNEQELATIQEHPRMSVEFVEQLGLPWEVSEEVLHHQEAYDGSGYPDGLAGRDIPIGARILSVVDAFFAMTSRRPNRETLREEDALQELQRNAGKQFDPEVVEVFCSLVQVHFLDVPEAHERPRRLVLVDDDRDLRSLIEMKFAALGYEVSAISDPENAEDAISELRPEAVLVNADVSWIDAYQLLHRLRQQPAMSAVAVLLLSGRDGTASARARALEAAADDYLVRPIGLKEIVQRVATAVRRKQRLGSADFVRAPQAGGIRGRLEEMGLAEICQILGQGMKTARVTIVDDKAQGGIYFENGQVRHASYLDRSGTDAFFAMLGIADGEFAIEHGLVAPEHTIDERLEFLLMEGMRQQDEARRELPAEIE